MERVATSLLAEARRAGLSVQTDGERLVVRGPKQHADLATKLLERKAEVQAALADTEEQAIQERMAVVRPLVPVSGPIPFLLLRQQDPGVGHCLSCGEPLGQGDLYRCRSCVEAVRRVLAEVEGKRGSKRGIS